MNLLYIIYKIADLNRVQMPFGAVSLSRMTHFCPFHQKNGQNKVIRDISVNDRFKPLDNQRHSRAFEAPSVINEFTIFKRRPATLVVDASTSKPVRPVPVNLSKQKPLR